MTMVNFCVEPGRVLIAVDTLGLNPAPHLHVNKLYPVAGRNLVLAGRGSMALVQRAAGVCGFMGWTLDEVKQNMGPLLVDLARSLRIEIFLRRQTAAVITGPQEVYVFGWSDAAGEMMALRFGRDAGARAFTLEDDILVNIAPRLNDGRDMAVHDAFAMKHLARTQATESLENYSGVGGQLILAELTRTRQTIEQMGELRPY